MKKTYLIAAAVAILTVAVAFFAEPKAPEPVPEAPVNSSVPYLPQIEESDNDEPGKNVPAEISASAGSSVSQTAPETEIAPVTENTPFPEKDEEDEKNICTISVTCKTILQNRDRIASEILALVPGDGVILAETTAEFAEGESVFDVTLKELRQSGIHYEFSKTPIYKSAYTEGIGNIYELDCGELSGWMYSVNGEFPGYGCSSYILKKGDRIEWVYTCDLGADLGISFGSGGQRDE